MVCVERIGLLHFERWRPFECARDAVFVEQGDDEVVRIHEHTGNGRATLRRDGHSYWALRRRTPSSAAAASPREQHALLNVDGLVLTSDACEIAARRVTRGALAGAVEILRACFRIARSD